MQELALAVKAAAKKLFDTDIEPEFTRPDEKFGDYATNVALQLAKQVGKSPREIAEELAVKAARRARYPGNLGGRPRLYKL
jgi:arginyl-tRNA synthetase